MPRESLFAPALLMLSLAAPVLVGQSPLGTITGTITDAQGARVPGVEVVASQVATNLTFKMTSSEDGTYSIPNLPVGQFTVTASHPGFKTFRRSGLTVEVSQRLRVDITLEVGAISESVTVSGEPPRVQTEESALGSPSATRRPPRSPTRSRREPSRPT